MWRQQWALSRRRLLDRGRRFALLGPRRNHGPALGDGDGLAHLNEELLIGVVMLPAPALVEIEMMVAPPLGDVSPFQRDAFPVSRGRKHAERYLRQAGGGGGEFRSRHE